MLALEVAELLEIHGEAADLVALPVGELVWGGGQGGGGLLAVPGDGGAVEFLGGGPVAGVPGDADLVAGEDGP